jgi:hypothetical protein
VVSRIVDHPARRPRELLPWNRRDQILEVAAST